MKNTNKIPCNLLITIIIMAIFAFNFPVLGMENEYDSTEVNKIMNETSVFELKAKSCILADSRTGSILLEKNSHDRHPIASITKVMSMLVVMEELKKGKITMEDTVPVSEYAYGFGGSQVYLKSGEVFTLNEMLKAIAIHSANDATVAVAEKIEGSEDAFVQKMNRTASSLNMKDTNFLDCTGLTDEGNYSSAYDIAIMSRELINRYPEILEYTSIWHDTFRNGEFSLDNTNKLVRHYQGATGLKTGFTNTAGYCLSATAKRDNIELIAVVLGEPTSNTRFAEASKLLNYGFANFEYVSLEKKDAIIQEIEVIKGLERKVSLRFKNDVNILLKKGDGEKVEKIINIPQSVEAPVKEGMKIGEAIYKVDGKEVPGGIVDIIAGESVEKASFIKLFIRMIMDWFGIGKNPL